MSNRSRSIFLFILFPAIIFVIASCKKESFIEPVPGHQKWMKVMGDTIYNSTDDEAFQGSNGKVVTDADDNIYLYYYNVVRNHTMVMKCDPLGNILWRKILPGCIPTDMIFSSDRKLVVAVRSSDIFAEGLVLYVMKGDTIENAYSYGFSGNYTALGINNAFIRELPDGSFLISGSMRRQVFTNVTDETVGFVLKLTGYFTREWTTLVDTGSLGASFKDTYFGQNSIIENANGKYMFEFSVSRNEEVTDSLGYGLLTGVLNTDGTIESTHFYFTGYRIVSSGQRHGYSSRYCNGLLPGADGAIYHYSAPDQFTPTPSIQPNAFLYMNNDATFSDTIPIQLPNGYRILSCIEKNGKFLMQAYKKGVASGTNDFSANQTYFLYGENYFALRTFYFQQFYADFFPSAALTSDGGYIIMGKIQSFNGTNNKLMLIKWNP